MVFSQNIPLPHSKNLSTRLNIPSWLKTSSSKKTSEEMASILIRSLKVTVNTFVLFVWLFDLQCDQSQVSVNVSRKVTYFQDPEWSYKSTKWYEVLDVKQSCGVEFYAIEDEPNHIIQSRENQNLIHLKGSQGNEDGPIIFSWFWHNVLALWYNSMADWVKCKKEYPPYILLWLSLRFTCLRWPTFQ